MKKLNIIVKKFENNIGSKYFYKKNDFFFNIYLKIL